MSSARTSRVRRFLHIVAPWLFKKCHEGNFHWRWDRLCYCRRFEYGGDPNWHGGIHDMKTEQELVPLRLAINPKTQESQTIPDTQKMPPGWRWF